MEILINNRPSTYAREMNAIDATALYKGLLCHGMFAEKLPPIFSSESFYEYSLKMTENPEDVPCHFIFFESIRNINTPRPMGIPHPMAYLRLCRCLKDNWSHLQEYFMEKTQGNTHKVSRIHIRKLKDRDSIFEMNYKNHKVDGDPEPDILIGSKYLVKADISTCFPSIYSHALTWALVTKETAKKNRNRNWFNNIDHFTQNLRHGETHGLLIGCHSSNLLSEIILVAVDNVMYDKGWRYIRNIDDYTCYVETYEKTQQFLIDLGSALRDYDLTLNHKKTVVAELPIGATEQWERRLNAFPIPDTDLANSLKYPRIKAYLDYAIELMQDNKQNSAILNYAIKVGSGQKDNMTDNARSYFVKTVFHLALLFPYLIPLLDELIFIPFKVKKNEIRKISQKIYSTGIAERNFEAVIYSIFFALKYNFTIMDISFERAKESNNCLFLLFAWLYTKRHHPTDEELLGKYCDYAKILLKDNDDFEQNWLFVYEVLGQSHFSGTWKNMKKKKISFLKDKKVFTQNL